MIHKQSSINQETYVETIKNQLFGKLEVKQNKDVVDRHDQLAKSSDEEHLCVGCLLLGKELNVNLHFG